MTALLPMLGSDVETMFKQHCVSTVSLLVPNIGDQHWTMFRQDWVNVVAMALRLLVTNAEMLCECCLNVGAQCWMPTFRQLSSNVV